MDFDAFFLEFLDIFKRTQGKNNWLPLGMQAGLFEPGCRPNVDSLAPIVLLLLEVEVGNEIAKKQTLEFYFTRCFNPGSFLKRTWYEGHFVDSSSLTENTYGRSHGKSEVL